MDLLLLAPLGMFACMAGLAALGLPGKPRLAAPKPAAPAQPAVPQQPVRLPPPPPNYAYAMLNGKPVLVPAGGAR